LQRIYFGEVHTLSLRYLGSYVNKKKNYFCTFATHEVRAVRLSLATAGLLY